MERTDLAALAAETKDMDARLDGLKESLKEAMDAALGDYDEATDTELSPGNGDAYETYEAALKKVDEAGFALRSIVGYLAEQQGYRDFADAGVAA